MGEAVGAIVGGPLPNGEVGVELDGLLLLLLPPPPGPRRAVGDELVGDELGLRLGRKVGVRAPPT